MICKKCGKNNQDEAKFCVKCGSELQRVRRGNSMKRYIRGFSYALVPLKKSIIAILIVILIISGIILLDSYLRARNGIEAYRPNYKSLMKEEIGKPECSNPKIKQAVLEYIRHEYVDNYAAPSDDGNSSFLEEKDFHIAYLEDIITNSSTERSLSCRAFCIWGKNRIPTRYKVELKDEEPLLTLTVDLRSSRNSKEWK
jgi:hypothetical protein